MAYVPQFSKIFARLERGGFRMVLRFFPFFYFDIFFVRVGDILDVMMTLGGSRLVHYFQGNNKVRLICYHKPVCYQWNTSSTMERNISLQQTTLTMLIIQNVQLTNGTNMVYLSVNYKIILDKAKFII